MKDLETIAAFVSAIFSCRRRTSQTLDGKIYISYDLPETVTIGFGPCITQDIQVVKEDTQRKLSINVTFKHES